LGWVWFCFVSRLSLVLPAPPNFSFFFQKKHVLGGGGNEQKISFGFLYIFLP